MDWCEGKKMCEGKWMGAKSGMAGEVVWCEGKWHGGRGRDARFCVCTRQKCRAELQSRIAIQNCRISKSVHIIISIPIFYKICPFSNWRDYSKYNFEYYEKHVRRV